MSQRENRGRYGQPPFGLRVSSADYQYWPPQQEKSQTHRGRGRGRGRGAFRVEYQESVQGLFRPEYQPYTWTARGRGRGAYRGNSREQSRDRLNISRSSSPVEGSEEFTMRKIEQTSAIIMRHLLSSEEVEVRPPSKNNKNPDTNKKEREQNSKQEEEKVTNTSTPKKLKPVRKKRKSSTRSNEDSQSLSYDIREIQNKIMNHITNMNDGKKKNLINAQVSGYDEAIRQIQRQKRLEISKALRNMCNAMDVGEVTTQESSNLINSIIPDVGIKIEDLPIDVIRSLRDILGMDEEEESSFQSGSTNFCQEPLLNQTNLDHCFEPFEIKKERQDDHDIARVTDLPEDERLLESQTQKDNFDPGHSTQTQNHYVPSQQLSVSPPSCTNLSSDGQIRQESPPVRIKCENDLELSSFEPVPYIKPEPQDDFDNPNESASENVETPFDKNIVHSENFSSKESSKKENNRVYTVGMEDDNLRDNTVNTMDTNFREGKSQQEKINETEEISRIENESLNISTTKSDDLDKSNKSDLKGIQDETMFLLNYDFDSDEYQNASGESSATLEHKTNNEISGKTNVNKTNENNTFPKNVCESTSYKNDAYTANSLNDIVESFFTDFKAKYGYCDTKSLSSVIGKMQFIDKCVEKLNSFRFSLFDSLIQQDILNRQTGINLSHQESKKRKKNLREEDSNLEIHTFKKSRMQEADEKTVNLERVGAQNYVQEANTSTFVRLKPASSLFEDLVEVQNVHKTENATKPFDTVNTTSTNSQSTNKDNLNKINIVTAKNNDDAPKSTIFSEAENDKQLQKLGTGLTDKIFDINFEFVRSNEKITQLKIYEYKIFLTSTRGRIYMYDLNSHEYDVLGSGRGVITSIAYLRNQERKTLYAGADATLSIHNLKGCSWKTKTVQISPVDRIQCMELEASWGFLFIGCASGTLVRYSISKETIEYQDKVMNNIQVLKATQEGPRKVLIVGNRMAPMCIRDAMSGLILRELSAILPTTYSLVFHRNLVICGTSKQSILVYKYQEGTFLKRLPVASKGISCMEQYKNLLFAGCTDGSLYVYQFNQKMEDKNLEPVYQKKFPGGSILCMAVLPRQIILKTMTKPICVFPMPKEILDRLTL